MTTPSSFTFESVDFAYPRVGLFGRRSSKVFADFSWECPPGRTVILGPNGAGKTTLLSLASTALMPDVGHVKIGELDPSRRRDRNQIRRQVGWMPQDTRAIPGLTGREQVAYAGWLKGLRLKDAWVAAGVALERVGLEAEQGTLTSSLSGGQRRRIGLACLLVHDAQLLLLDEPTAGLDPGQRMRFRDTIRAAGEGSNVVVSTHQVDDLTNLFDTVVVLDHARVVFEDSVAAFMALAPAGSAHPSEAAYASLVDPEP